MIGEVAVRHIFYPWELTVHPADRIVSSMAVSSPPAFSSDACATAGDALPQDVYHDF
jgi:hypothetical protein